VKTQLHATTGRAKLWAGITLAVAVATSSAMTIANAEAGQHRARPDKTKTCSSVNACVAANNTSSGAAIQGTGATGYGLAGYSTSGPGVYGLSSSNYGVLGMSNGFFAGVGGYNSYSSSGASGVYGDSTNGPGVDGYSQTSYAVQAEGTVLAEGNVFVQGEVYTEGDCQLGCSRSRHEASFSARTAQPTIDDVGEGDLREGVAHVSLASDFANAIDAQKRYVVLLTPEGDASLYVANRTTHSFDVREIGGGHSSIGFAYRIVAKPYGVADERLPFKVETATKHQPAVR